MLPQFFCDERHERMQQFQQVVEEAQRFVVSLLINRLSVSRFDHFQIPAREFIPEQFVNGHQGFAQTIFSEKVFYLGNRLVQHGFKPFCSQTCIFRLIYFGSLPSLNQTERIPYLVIEVTTLFTKSLIKQDIVSGRRTKHHTHTHTISSVLINQLQRVGRVTQRFRHFTTDLITHDSGKINILKRHIAHIFVTRHNHTRHPEEDNIRTGNQIGGRIIIFDFFIAGVVNAVEQRDRPQPR